MLEGFEALMRELLERLDGQNLSIAVHLAKLYLKVRGFGHVKMASYEQVVEEQAALLAEFRAPAQVIRVFDPSASEAA